MATKHVRCILILFSHVLAALRIQDNLRSPEVMGIVHAPRRGSATARLLGLRVRIPPRSWMSLLSGLCCQVEVSASD